MEKHTRSSWSARAAMGSRAEGDVAHAGHCTGVCKHKATGQLRVMRPAHSCIAAESMDRQAQVRASASSNCCTRSSRGSSPPRPSDEWRAAAATRANAPSSAAASSVWLLAEPAAASQERNNAAMLLTMRRAASAPRTEKEHNG